MSKSIFKNKSPFKAKLAVAAASAVTLAAKVLNRAASSKPGEIALKFDPDLLERLCAGRKIILLTGTNGKTTTVKALSEILAPAFDYCVFNRSGANLRPGLISSMLENKDVLRKDNADSIFIFEIDEAHFAKHAGAVKPEAVIVTNLYEDQNDRFGDMQNIRKLIAEGIARSHADFGIFCADDPQVVAVAEDCREVLPDQYFFGHKSELDNEYRSTKKFAEIPEALQESFDFLCPRCNQPLKFREIYMADLGDFYCPNCKLQSPASDLDFYLSEKSAEELKKENAKSAAKLNSIDKLPGKKPEHSVFLIDDERYDLFLNLPGIYNSYNAAAAFLAADKILEKHGKKPDYDRQRLAQELEDVNVSFGRMEAFRIRNNNVWMILAKNPAGFRESLNFVLKRPDLGGLQIIVNAEENDGRDCSWMEKVNFPDYFKKALKMQANVAASGRAVEKISDIIKAESAKDEASKDMLSQVEIDNNAEALFERLLSKNKPDKTLYILPNYTAMMEIRAYLSKRYGVKEFWN